MSKKLLLASLRDDLVPVHRKLLGALRKEQVSEQDLETVSLSMDMLALERAFISLLFQIDRQIYAIEKRTARKK